MTSNHIHEDHMLCLLDQGICLDTVTCQHQQEKSMFLMPRLEITRQQKQKGMMMIQEKHLYQ